MTTSSHQGSDAAIAAGGKVLWHFTMSLDGFIAGPDHNLGWMAGMSATPGLIESYAGTTGAVLAGRDGFQLTADVGGVYGGAWHGPVFILTHHPEDAPHADGATILSCDVAEARHIALHAAGGKNLEIFSASIGRQLLALGLIDEIHLHVAPVLLGDGIRLYDNPGGTPVPLELLTGDDPVAAVHLRYRPSTLVPAGTASP